MTESLPWVKWHFDKWRNDDGLRMCGLAARGLWADLLAIMHGAIPYGHLSVQGRAPSPRQIASLVGMTTEREVTALLSELEINGVFSRTESGLIFCRRLVRDNAARERGKAFGSLGGNPALIVACPKEDNQQTIQEDNQNATARISQNINGGLTPPDNPEKRREEKEKKDPPYSPPRTKTRAKARSAIDPEWQPDAAGLKFAADRRVNANAEVPKFRDYHAAKGNLMADWAAAWRTWCGNAQAFARGPSLPLTDEPNAPRKASDMTGTW